MSAPEPVASIIVPCWGERRKLLERSLACLHNQTVPVQVVVVDDASDIGVSGYVRGGSDDFYDDCYMLLRPYPGPHRRPNTALRAGYWATVADYVVLSEPELLVPKDAVERMMAGHERKRRDVPILYCLDQRMTWHLDELAWQDDLTVLQKLPGFWSYTGIFNMSNEEAKGWRHHWGFCGAYRDEWALTDFLPEGESVETDPDNWLRAREEEQGRVQRTTDFAVYHQWHERVNLATGDLEPMSMQQRRIRDMKAKERW